MEKKSSGWFDALFDVAGKFIESQRGVWDRTVWPDLLEGLLEKGYELTDDMKTYTGSVFEVLKKFSNAMSATRGMNQVITDIVGHTVSFMNDTTRVWDQREWSSFLKELKEQGIDLTDEMMNYLEGVLEVVQEIYTIPPIVSKTKEPWD
jgi:hypothetical protein